MSATTPTLMLVEDNDIDAELVQRLVSRLALDLKIVRAHDGENAFDMLCPPDGVTEPLRPSVIVLDLNMPRMNGFELLERLADEEEMFSVPVFVLSTSGTQRDRTSARRHRVRGYLVKPLRAPQLLDVLGSIAPATDAHEPPTASPA